jgi:dihydroxy-acid dehydratase
VFSLPCIGDGRQSGTSGTPSILNASPEAAANGGLALLKTATACASTSTNAAPTS